MDADLLVQRVVESIDAVAELAGPRFSTVGAVATSVFWHSLVGVDGRGRAITPLYPWLDARSRGEAELLRRRLDERAVHARTGCVLHWSYLPAKLLWVRRSAPDLFRRVKLWLSFGEYLMLRLFGRTSASISMASGTGLFDQRICRWDGELLTALSLEEDRLPSIAALDEPLTGPRRAYAGRWPALRHVLWLPPLGDGACSNLGAGCTTRERYALMIGTSGALRALWRAEEFQIPWGVWCYRADRHRIVMGGALNDGGELMAWLRRSLRLPALGEIDAAVAALEPDAHGLTVLPFWGGERSPGWAEDARGAVIGLRLDTGPIEILRAAMEAVALRFASLEAILRRVVPEVREVIGTGGALLHSPAWLQIMADALGLPVTASTESEASSRGAALLALETLGLLPAELEAVQPPVGAVYEPVPSHTERYRAAAERQSRLYDLLVTRD